MLFFSGCDLRCPWCHNPELVTGGAESSTGFEECLVHLRKRRPVLGGVVLSGGEPCLQDDLPGFIIEIKKLGLPVKLDTNGMLPVMLMKLFNNEETRPDYIALDLKIAPHRYNELLPANLSRTSKGFNPAEALIQSAALIRESRIPHEYRSLVLPGSFFSEKDVEALAPLADNSPWYFRPFRGGNCLDPDWDSLEESAEEAAARTEALAKKAGELGRMGLAPGIENDTVVEAAS